MNKPDLKATILGEARDLNLSLVAIAALD